MGAQSTINGLIGASAGAISVGNKLLKGSNLSNSKAPTSGKDIQMAAKARREVLNKINAINANKEISSKAKTRRIGKVIDNYGSNK